MIVKAVCRRGSPIGGTCAWRPISDGVHMASSRNDELERRLNQLSQSISHMELKEIISMAAINRYPICKHYGPLAFRLQHTTDECDPDLIVSVYSKLQNSHNIELYMPARAWLVSILNDKLVQNSECFDSDHIAQLCRLSFLPKNIFYPVLAEKLRFQLGRWTLATLQAVLAMIVRDNWNSENAREVISLSAATLRSLNTPDTGIDVAAENTFFRYVVKVLNLTICDGPILLKLTSAIVERAHKLSNKTIPHEPLLSSETVCFALARVRRIASSRSNTLRAFLNILMLGRSSLQVDLNLSCTMIFNACSGMIGIDSNHSETRQVLSFLQFHLHSLLERNESVQIFDKTFLSILGGMRNFSSDDMEVKALLRSYMRCEIVQQSDVTTTEFFRNIAAAVRGLSRMDLSIGVVQSTIDIITRIFAVRIEDKSFAPSSSDIVCVLASLQALHSENEAVRSLLKLLATLLRRGRPFSFSGQDISSILFGFQNCDSDYAEVREILHYLVSCIRNCNDDLGAKGLSMALSGLRTMNSKSPEVLMTISELTRMAHDNTERLTAQGIAMCLLGLRYSSSEHQEVRRIVALLTQKIEHSLDLEFGAQEISMCYSGMQNMFSCHEEVIALLRVLNHKASKFRGPLTGQGIAMCIQGLRLCWSDRDEVRRMAQLLSVWIFNSPDAKLTDQGIVMCLKSLRYLSSDDNEVRMLLVALTMKLNDSRDALSPVDVLNCLRGLKGMKNDCKEVGDLLVALKSKIHPGDGNFWWKEIIRSDVFGSNDLVQDLRFYSSYSQDFYNILRDVLVGDIQ